MSSPSSARLLDTDPRALRAAVVRQQRDTGQAFLYLAQAVPRVFGAAASLVEATRSSGHARALESAAREVRLAASVLTEFGGEAAARGVRIDGLAGELAGHTATLATDLVAVGALARDMRILALNALVAAARDDVGSGCLVVLTDALVDVAKRVAGVAAAARAASGRIQAGVGEARAQLSAVARRRHAIEEIQRMLDQGLEALLAQLASASVRVEEARVATQPVLEGAGRVMASIQRQDAISQGQGHVLLALETLVDEPDRSRRARLAARVAPLCVTLLGDLRADLDGLCAEVGGALDHLHTVAAHLESLTGAQAAIQGGAREAAGALEAARTTLFASEDERGIVAALGGLDEDVALLEQNIGDLEEILRLLRTLRVMIRIELARAEEGADADIVGRIDAACRAAEGLVARLRSSAASLPLSLREIRGILQVGDALRARASVRTGDVVNAATAALTDAARVAGDDMAAFVALGATLRGEVSAFQDRLARIQEQRADWEELRAACRVLGEEGGRVEPGDDEFVAGRLRTLVDRFTVLAHKELAVGVQVDGGEGSPPGDLELF